MRAALLLNAESLVLPFSSGVFGDPLPSWLHGTLAYLVFSNVEGTQIVNATYRQKLAQAITGGVTPVLC